MILEEKEKKFKENFNFRLNKEILLSYFIKKKNSVYNFELNLNLS